MIAITRHDIIAFGLIQYVFECQPGHWREYMQLQMVYLLFYTKFSIYVLIITMQGYFLF
jgi:hypothetical protein